MSTEQSEPSKTPALEDFASPRSSNPTRISRVSTVPNSSVRRLSVADTQRLFRTLSVVNPDVTREVLQTLTLTSGSEQLSEKIKKERQIQGLAIGLGVQKSRKFNKSKSNRNLNTGASGIASPKSEPLLSSDSLLGDASEEEPLKQFDWENDRGVLYEMLVGSYLNLLLLLVPLGFLSFYLKWSKTVIFFINFLAMIPLASILGDATEHLAEHLGESLGGLLNSTFGNAVEIVVMVLALVKARSYDRSGNKESRDTMLRVVQTSLIGSIFSNALLVLGCAFVANGYVEKESSFNKTATSANVSLLMIGAFVMILPSPYADDHEQHDELLVSRAAAVILLGMYASLIYFVLFTHKDLIDAPSNKPDTEKSISKEDSYVQMTEKSPTPLSEKQRVMDSVNSRMSARMSGNGVELMDELLDSDQLLEEISQGGGISLNDDDDDEEEEEQLLSLVGSMLLLLFSTILVAILSEYLVGSLEGMADSVGMSEAFVGLILLPIIGNAVEHITAIRMAVKCKMDIAISIAIGSATQVAMFVVGLAVIVGWMLDVPLSLAFPSFESQLFIYTSIIIFALVSDGSSNWLEGVALLGLYILIAIAVWDQKFDDDDE